MGSCTIDVLFNGGMGIQTGKNGVLKVLCLYKALVVYIVCVTDRCTIYTIARQIVGTVSITDRCTINYTIAREVAGNRLNRCAGFPASRSALAGTVTSEPGPATRGKILRHALRARWHI